MRAPQTIDADPALIDTEAAAPFLQHRTENIMFGQQIVEAYVDVELARLSCFWSVPRWSFVLSSACKFCPGQMFPHLTQNQLTLRLVSCN